MKNILIRLGLIKIESSEFFKTLEKLHDDMATMLLKEKGLEGDKYNKAVCEIKIFFWVFAEPLLNKNMREPLYDETMKFFRNNIIFSTIDESLYSDEYITSMLHSRFEFHENGIRGKDKFSIFNSYFQQLSVMWFEHPFCDVGELSKIKGLGIDKNIMGELETQQIYIHLAPAYTKSLMRLIKITKK